MVKLIFSADTSMASRVVRIATFSWCSHVSIICPDNTVIESIPSAGVVKTPYKTRINQSSRFEIYQVDADEQKTIAYAESQLGKPYDWAGILGWGLRRDWQEDDAWFCNELVAKSLLEAGTPVVNSELYRITPRDLLISPLLERVA